jgi:hypothetical protein
MSQFSGESWLKKLLSFPFNSCYSYHMLGILKVISDFQNKMFNYYIIQIHWVAYDREPRLCTFIKQFWYMKFKFYSMIIFLSFVFTRSLSFYWLLHVITSTEFQVHSILIAFAYKGKPLLSPVPILKKINQLRWSLHSHCFQEASASRGNLNQPPLILPWLWIEAFLIRYNTYLKNNVRIGLFSF